MKTLSTTRLLLCTCTSEGERFASMLFCMAADRYTHTHTHTHTHSHTHTAYSVAATLTAIFASTQIPTLTVPGCSYTVGMFGKYLNNNPTVPPRGIDAYMTNGGGNYYSPQFDTQGVSDLAPYFMKDGSWQVRAIDLTSPIRLDSLLWISFAVLLSPKIHTRFAIITDLSLMATACCDRHTPK
jgi:hypothetical protein